MMKKVECNNLSHLNNFRYDESMTKYCNTWCSCDINLSRDCFRDENTDICKKKVREMKAVASKNFSFDQGYENMDLDYDCSKNHKMEKEGRYEYCRIRSNLCELPTSYVSNNHQLSNNIDNVRLSKETSDYVDLKSVTYENNLKFVDFNDQLENLGSMLDKSKNDHLNKISPIKKEYLRHGKKIDGRSPLKNGYVYPNKNSSKIPCEQTKCNQNNVFKESCGEFRNTNSSPDFKNNCREYCPLVDFKYHSLSDHRFVCYDTSTYFDKRNEMPNICYSSEVEYLRDKLKTLQKSTYFSYANFNKNQESTEDNIPSIIPQDDLNASDIKDIYVSTINIKPKLKKERRIFSPPLVKARHCLSLRTKSRINSAKIKRVKSKKSAIAINGPNCNESGTETEDEHEVEEEAETISEQLTEEATKESSSSDVRSNGPEAGSGDSVSWPVRPSLFPNIPPYIRFNSHDAENEVQVPNGRKFFKWKLSTITPVIVRKTLTNSGFALVRKSNQWLGTWGKHMKSPMFKNLRETQKLNHFPGTFQLGRKDRLWRNFQRMIKKFGLKEFGFLPHTYILPQELKLLKQNWEFKNGSGGEMWIIKPPASARGTGIKVINKWSQLPKKTSLVVQKYISNPYLINGSKFDLRLYVLVTSFHPLRIYLYPDGLARFASAKYSEDAKDLKDKFMHLTNYSINKFSTQYTANEDANACQGHKWTISKLMEYLQGTGVDSKALWKNLQHLVIKTMIACEPPITQLCEENLNNYYNCYELFGIDVLLDEDLKPWLLEVNISPSLHSSSPLDAHIKGPLVQMLFDLAQFNFPPRLSRTTTNAPQCFDPKVYVTSLTKKERAKHALFVQYERREDYLQDILKNLSGDDVRQLVRAEDEYVVKGKFERIFPNSQSHKYLNFMEPRYYNRLFDAWEHRYGNHREEGIALLQQLCAQKVHLKTAPPSTLNKNLPSTIPLDVNLQEMNLQPSKEGHRSFVDEPINQNSIVKEMAVTA